MSTTQVVAEVFVSLCWALAGYYFIKTVLILGARGGVWTFDHLHPSGRRRRQEKKDYSDNFGIPHVSNDRFAKGAFRRAQERILLSDGMHLDDMDFPYSVMVASRDTKLGYMVILAPCGDEDFWSYAQALWVADTVIMAMAVSNPESDLMYLGAHQNGTRTTNLAHLYAENEEYQDLIRTFRED